MPNCRVGVELNTQEGNISRFFKMEGVILKFDPALHLGTKEYSICNQPVLFAKLENVNELWNKNRTVHVNEQNQNKSKTK